VTRTDYATSKIFTEYRSCPLFIPIII